MDVLSHITERTVETISKRKKKVAFNDFNGFEDYNRDRRSLYATLKRNPFDWVRIIAEIKKASPSKGVIRQDFNPILHARQYEASGASAISVLTEEDFFQGKLEFMRDVSHTVSLPILRKDFIVDPYQIQEARAWGADAVLLIATITSGSQLAELHHAATEAGLECLVECYSREDLSKISYQWTRILGVNNRNLSTFEVNVHRGLELLSEAPDGVVTVSESGLSSRQDISLLYQSCIDAALIGESFMAAPDPGIALKKLTEPDSNS
jgi:indole-3-glycerol phosphate synthase